jgi:NADH-quinone oxidoreductase subunit G
LSDWPRAQLELIMPASPPKPKTAPDTLTVVVDGKPVTVPRTMPDPLNGRPLMTTMIQACEAAGVVVPHYCYHPKLPVAGNCRMCLVEFGLPALGPDRQTILNPDGTPKIVRQTLPYDPSVPRVAIACATPVSPGMEIYTNTATARKTREAVLESLLINHPLDCPICDQAGECKLQQYSVEYGKAESHFAETKVHKPKQVDLGPRIMLDDERCILCSRCIRFTRDVVGDDALGIVNRGSYSTLTNYPGRPFDNNYTLNTVDICPVGALTSKDFRFQMRVWFLKETKSLCASCGTGCNLVISSREDRIYRFEPRQNDLVNSCWMCDFGRLNYKWIHRDDRLIELDKRNAAGGVQAIGWSVALREIADKIRAFPPGAIAIVASARQTNEELYLLKRLADRCEALTDSVPRTGEADHLLVSADRNPNSAGSRRLAISGAELGERLPAIAAGIAGGRVRGLIVFGEDVTRHGIGAELLERLDLLVVSDVLPNATTARAHYLLPGCAHAEKRGSFVNVKGQLQRFIQAIAPPGNARPEWEFLAECVGQVLGEPFPSTIEGLFNQMAREIPAFQGQTWAGLGDQGKRIS